MGICLPRPGCSTHIDLSLTPGVWKTFTVWSRPTQFQDALVNAKDLPGYRGEHSIYVKTYTRGVWCQIFTGSELLVLAVSMTSFIQEKAQCVMWFAEFQSIVAFQCIFRRDIRNRISKCQIDLTWAEAIQWNRNSFKGKITGKSKGFQKRLWARRSRLCLASKEMYRS